MEHPLCCIHNFHRRPLVAVLAGAGAVPVVDVEAVPAVDVEAVPAVDVEAVPVVDVEAVPVVDVEAVPAGVDGLLLHLAACMPGMCGSTTVYIVLRNLMDYCMLDIDSFLFLRPSKRVNRKNNTSIKT